jgi:tRNA (mo5U34)-methyltransferase
MRGAKQEPISLGYINMTIDDLKREVEKINWWHRIDLGNGIITPGIDRSPEKLKTLHMPDDLHGKTVLDIGAWDGFFSFEAERRGASRVLATDSFCWGGEGWGTKEGFNFARQALHSQVEDMEIDVMKLSPENVGVFDLVLFLGVLYHMPHPLLALEKVFSVTGDRLILETQVDMLCTKRPAAAFYPGTELKNDPTNWWGPNRAAVTSMLSTVGFKRVEIVSLKPPFALRFLRALRSKLKEQKAIVTTLQQARMVVHAWK